VDCPVAKLRPDGGTRAWALHQPYSFRSGLNLAIRSIFIRVPVLIQIDENPNCASVDGLVFAPRTPPRIVTQVRVSRNGKEDWCKITGLDDRGVPCPATAAIIDDSGDGACYLVVGGSWGFRLKPATEDSPWSLGEAEQWGEPFLMLGSDDADLRFEE